MNTHFNTPTEKLIERAETLSRRMMLKIQLCKPYQHIYSELKPIKAELECRGYAINEYTNKVYKKNCIWGYSNNR